MNKKSNSGTHINAKNSIAEELVCILQWEDVGGRQLEKTFLEMEN